MRSGLLFVPIAMFLAVPAATAWSFVSDVPRSMPPPPAALGSPGPAPPPGPTDPPFGPNVRVSENDTPGNQNEITMAVASDGRVHMGWNDLRQPNPDYRCGYAYSADRGRTWSANRLFHLPGWDASGDPVVVVDANDVVYLVCMSFSRSGGGSRIVVYRSADGGATWNSGAIASDTTNGLNDKPWAHAAGTTVHVCYANFGANPAELRYTRSADGGATWSPTRVLDRGGNGCQFASDNAGNLYVAWWTGGSMRFTKSTDGGATWTVPRSAASVSWTDWSGPRAYPLPSMAADRASGTVYLAWHNDDGVGGWDIRIVRTTDGGATWSAPITVNDVPSGYQLMPAIAVGPDGTVHAVWYDTRSGRFALRHAQSTTGGTTWSASTRVTDTEFTADPIFIGDYIASAATSQGVYAAWTDTRTGENEAFFATTASAAPRLSRIDVAPPEAWTDADTPVQFVAVGYDQFGNPYPANPTWAATGGSVSAGWYTPQRAGDWRVWANESGVSGSAVVHVSPGALARIDVTPADVTITADDTQQYAATGYDAKGNVVPIAPAWGAGEGSITGGGLYTPRRVGTWTIYANASGITGRTSVAVTPGALAGIWVTPSTVTITADATQPFTATGHDGKGNPIPVSPAWGAGEGSITGGGLYTPRRVGTWLVYANASGLTGTAQVTVLPGALARVVVTPADARITADDAIDYTATGYDAKGNVVAINPSWAASAGTIDAAGRYVPGPVGTHVVTARAGPVSGSTTVTVAPGRLARIDVTPPTATITADETLRLAAAGSDARGNSVAVNPTWAATCGSVDGTGVFTPGPARLCRVYANESGVSGSAAITVVAGALARIDVTPPTATITADDVLQYAASGYDGKGNPVPVAPTWAADEGSITPLGTYTPRRVGTWTVYANATGVVGAAAIRVLAGALAGIRVDPPTATITADGAQQFTATGHDGKGNEIPPASPVWSAADGTIVDGLFTPRRVGTWAIAAEEGGRRGAASVTVTPGAVARVVVEPGDVRLPEGGTTRFTARAYDGKGNEVPDADISWRVDGGVGTVDGSGGFAAGDAGVGSVTATATDGTGTASGRATVVVEAGLRTYAVWGSLLFVVLVALLLLVFHRRRRKGVPPPL